MNNIDANELDGQMAETGAIKDEQVAELTPIMSATDSTAPFIPLAVKKGDYLINKSGFITRVDEVDADGNVLDVWNRPFLAYDIVVNGINIFSPVLPAEGKKPFVKLIDGSNTRSILLEGMIYRVSLIYDSKYVEIVGAPGLFPLDIFTVVE